MKGVWVWIVGAFIVLALGLWWFAASMPLPAFPSISALWSGPSEPVETATTTPSQQAATEPQGGAAANVQVVNRRTSDVSSVIASISGTSQFNALFRSTGVSSSLKANGTYTVFVPTNGAMGQLPGGTIANMSAAEKKRLVQYHVVEGVAIDSDALVSGTRVAMSQDELNFSYAENRIPMVNSAIVVTEYRAKNGVVYLIDNVLLPPKRSGI